MDRVKNFPHAEFDHHANFGGCFSHCARACNIGGSKNRGRCRSRTLWTGPRLTTPWKHAHAKCRRCRSNRSGVGRGVSKDENTRAPPPSGRAWLTPQKHTSPHTCLYQILSFYFKPFELRNFRRLGRSNEERPQSREQGPQSDFLLKVLYG